MESVNRLHLYMGEGKGKTTAAMGLALRMLGHERRVLVAQFLKSGTSGELRALRTVKGVIIVEMPAFHKFTSQMNEAERARAQTALTIAIRALIAQIEAQRPDLIVLDELALAAQLTMLSEESAHALIDAALAQGEVALTGRYAPQSIIDRADYVSEITKRTHPFDEGVPARKGVEF